jgi:magnesium chelatase family protein
MRAEDGGRNHVLALAFSATMIGVDGHLVRVEADSAPGTPGLAIIGLPDRALNEARDRVRTAIHHCGYVYPAGRLLVNLSPADLRKEGSAFDLAIALALLALDEQVDRAALRRFVALGEIALDGAVRPVAGILPMVAGARDAGLTAALVPRENGDEAALVDGMEIYAVRTLHEAVGTILGNGATYKHDPSDDGRVLHADPSLHGDLADVRGQCAAKRALEIAAAGGHNLLFVGPPGCGKTMLARRLPSILPPMDAREALEVTKIYSVAGLLPPGSGIARARPFRAPHHTASRIALAGGGARIRPGEITLAHNGVLFLDELPEFGRASIEVMRQPLEEGLLTIARAAGHVTYPACFQLIASMNPCPCGMRGVRDAACRCDDAAVARYTAKISGPLLDRIDLRVELGRVRFDEMIARQRAESSSTVRERVYTARQRQRQRFQEAPFSCNAAVPGDAVRRWCTLDPPATELLARAAERHRFSARALDRIARVARTIADLAGREQVGADDAAEALHYRTLG